MNTYGKLFRVHIFGESHGESVGVTIDGCPAGICIDKNDFLQDIQRRKPVKKGSTARKEEDKPELLTGIYNGYTTGAPITLVSKNENIQSKDYKDFEQHPRPGHADFVSMKKYKGYADQRGSGHFSGRLTWGLVVAGVLAKKIISGMNVQVSLVSVNGSKDIDKQVETAMSKGDSVGGIVECAISNVPIGLGEPFFASVESSVASIVFSIPAVKGLEFGSGFHSAQMMGSEHNDLIINDQGKTVTNHSGGINGGISNGNDIVFRLAVKPPSSISKVQETYHFGKQKITGLEVKGRHDACIALRMPVVVEAAAAIALADLYLQEKSR
ncbi:MAG: chorismate synthase [Marinilabiliales bacterium]|nr:MAG: chorismate synthase [Marinilabiliales bacterium]